MIIQNCYISARACPIYPLSLEQDLLCNKCSFCTLIQGPHDMLCMCEHYSSYHVKCNPNTKTVPHIVLVSGPQTTFQLILHLHNIPTRTLSVCDGLGRQCVSIPAQTFSGCEGVKYAINNHMLLLHNMLSCMYSEQEPAQKPSLLIFS